MGRPSDSTYYIILILDGGFLLFLLLIYKKQTSHLTFAKQTVLIVQKLNLSLFLGHSIMVVVETSKRDELWFRIGYNKDSASAKQ